VGWEWEPELKNESWVGFLGKLKGGG
jgi:hypothetical protein